MEDIDILVLGDKAKELVKYCTDNVKHTHESKWSGITRSCICVPCATHWVALHFVTLDKAIEADDFLISEVIEPYEMCLVVFDYNDTQSANEAVEIVHRFVAPTSIAKSKLTKGVVGAGMLVGLGAPESSPAGALDQDPEILSAHPALQSLRAEFSNMPMVRVKSGGMDEFVKCFQTLSSWSFLNFTKLHPDHSVPCAPRG